MSTRYVHIVPVGTSLISHLEQTQGTSGAAVPRVLRNVFRPERPIAETLRAASANGRLNLTPHLQPDEDLAEKAAHALAQLEPATCAELSTLETFQVHDARADPAADVLVLVASDTGPGLRAAALLAHRLAAASGHLPRYVHDPLADGQALTLTLTEGPVILLRIPGLDLTRDKRPDPRTWQSLGELAFAVATTLCEAPHGWHAEFHLTGGYRATLPYLLMAAEAVHTVVRRRLPQISDRVRATVVHESSTGRENAVPLPVRFLTGALLDAVQELSTMAGENAFVTEDHSDMLRGLYVEDEPSDGRWNLTELGLITTRVLWALRNPALRNATP